MSKPRSKPFQTIYTQMDEQVKANHRWTSGPNQEGTQNFFIRYASGNDNSRRQVDTVQSGGEIQRQFISEVSQTSYADNFKKIKYNQMQALKELRQEYQILRNLPLQDDFLGRSHMKKQPASDFESSHQQQESLSSSSKQTDKRKSRTNQNHSQSQAKDTQILTLEKRQLELVIGNSMRKIQELLNNEIQYKKVIHELQIQLDSKNTDDKYDSLSKTMKRNEIEFNDRIESLKKDIERLKQINLQLQNKIDSLESQLEIRNQQLRKCRDEKRVLEDSLRLQKDRYMNLQIDIKRVRMESQILEKDKNNEIKQLKLLLQASSNKIIQPDTTEIRRLQDELKSAKHQYDMLLNEFDRYKRQVNQKPVQVKDNKQNEDMLKVFDTLISHLKDQSVNQNKASIDLIASMVAKYDEKSVRERERQRERKQRERQVELQQLEREKQRERQRQKERERQLERQKEKKEREREREKERKKQEKSTIKVIQDPNANRLLQQLFHLRNQVSTLKRDKDDLNKSSPMINLAESMADYQSKIRKLEQEIADGSITKEKLLKEYEIVKSSYDYATKENQRLTQEVLKLRERINQAEHHGQLSTQQIRIVFRQKEQEYQQTIRQLRRQVDQALFAVDKARKEGQFNLGLLRSQNETNLKLLREQISRVESERQLLKTQLNKMKAFYESKIQEKNALLEKTAQQFAVQCETKEKTLVSYKANSQRQMNELIRKMEGVAQLNERYLKQSTLLSTYERELSQLRYAVKRMKGMNEGVDHLWQVKETEYYNLNDVLRQLKGQ